MADEEASESGALTASDAMADDAEGTEGAEGAASHERKQQQRKRWPLVLLALAALGLAIGLGVGLGAQDKTNEAAAGSEGDVDVMADVEGSAITLGMEDEDNIQAATPSEGEVVAADVPTVVEFTVANLNDDGTNKFRIQLRPEWAPIGVERFQDLTEAKFWDDVRIFRVVPHFVSQFGISSDPVVGERWEAMGPIDDDPVVASNERGTVTFATAGENTRTTQIFINTANNQFLDNMGFAPIGQVLPAGEGYGGMEVVDDIYAGYGERPDQGRMGWEGAAYLEEEFPLLSYFEKAEFVAE